MDKTDDQKVEKNQNLVAPKDQKGVKRKECVAGYSKLCAPLFELSKKGYLYVWSQESDNAWNKLKQALTSALILAFPNMNFHICFTWNS